MRRFTVGLALSLFVTAVPLHAQVALSRVLESFDDASAFSAVPSDGVRLSLRADSGVAGKALRMAFDFQGHAGYAVARRKFSLSPLPPHWALTLWVRGDARPNTLELKLVDSSGQNVWWLRRPELQVMSGWTRLRFRSSDLSFAWGPLGGGAPKSIGFLEIAFTAGQGGTGWIALDDLTLTTLAAPVSSNVRPKLAATSSAAKQPAESALPWDFASSPNVPRLYGDRAGWRSAEDGVQMLTLDFGGTRQLSALVLDWSDTRWPVDYDVESSDDGRTWTALRQIRHSAGGRRYVHLPLAETARLRLVMRRSNAGKGYQLNAVHVLSDSAASTRSAFLSRVAEGSAAGMYPRQLTGQQAYWTVIGIPRDERDGLVSEDGNVESRPGGFSLEPFLVTNADVLTWKEGTTSHSLEGGWRPIPTASRTTKELSLATTTFATGTTGESIIWVRYRVVNRTSRTQSTQLVVALRPIQVNPPWQFLGTAGGASRITRLRVDGTAFVVNDTDRVVALTPWTSAEVATFDAGGLSTLLDAHRAASAERATSLVDSTGFAEGAMRWTLRLSAHDSSDVWLAMPAVLSDAAARAIPATTTRETAASFGEARLADARMHWNAEAGATYVDLPADGTALSTTLQSALAYVLINARGPAIQPGTRSYRRSWIRDGALTSAALMRVGHANDARAFLDWYVPHVFADGKVPCCVDVRGSDPVTENDADGELLFLAAEYFRTTKDSATVLRHWPTLRRVASHLDSLRQSRRTAQYSADDSLIVFGLLPPSISHEGYSAKPAYSYWDDWWGVRGLDDAGLLARVVRDDSAAKRFSAAGREMRTDVVTSVARSMAHFHLKALPGAAELGDLDPTSSTIALEPAQALADLPRDAVLATFDSAWATLQRRAGKTPWSVFTPYEWRDVGAMIRLGQADRADAYSTWLMSMRRPIEWNEWSEAIWQDPRAPKFIGDMPHGWVMSDFVRATLDRVAYEREQDSVLVVGAGIPDRWATDAKGVNVRNLHTWWGALNLSVHGDRRVIRVQLDGVTPPGGVELWAPFGRVPLSAVANGRPISKTHDGRAVLVRAPAVVEFRY